MKDKECAILAYLYHQRSENGINSASLIELPNTDGIDYLFSNGYILLDRDQKQTIKKVSLSGKGVDWGKNNLGLAGAITRALATTEVSITSDVISIKVRGEIYDHIKRYLDTGDYFHAVDEAYKVVRKKFKDITGNEKASDVFNNSAQSTAYYEVLFGKTEPADEAEADFFRGIGYLHLGVQHLRNEKSHTLATTLDKNLALHYISLASLAYDLITRNRGTIGE
jgi:uncharacterized protein (TIGR02391 family)